MLEMVFVLYLDRIPEHPLEKMNRTWRSELAATESEVFASSYGPSFVGMTGMGIQDPHAIIGGMDISGNPSSDNQNCLGFVMGDVQNLTAMVRKLKLDNNVHMSGIRDPHKRDYIKSNVGFDGRNSMALCIRYNKNKSVNKVRFSKTMKNKRIPIKRIYYEYNYSLYNILKRHTEGFLLPRHHTLHDVVYQCDYDCRFLATDTGSRCVDVGVAHKLADVVAWLNSRNIEPPGVVQINADDTIDGDLARCFGLRSAMNYSSKR